MRHHYDMRKLGRTTAHRLAMFKNMAVSLIHHGRLETTVAKAKELRRVADRMITLGKRGDLHARRQAASFLQDQQAVRKLFSEWAPCFQARMGGYTRVLKLGYRWGDAAPMAIIEYLAEARPEVAADKTSRRKRGSRGGSKAAAGDTAAKKSRQAEVVPAEKKSVHGFIDKISSRPAKKPAAQAKAVRRTMPQKSGGA